MTARVFTVPCCGASLPEGKRYVETTCSIGHCVTVFCAGCGAYLLVIGAEHCPCRTKTCHG